jgi:hypothetical protein
MHVTAAMLGGFVKDFACYQFKFYPTFENGENLFDLVTCIP